MLSTALIIECFWYSSCFLSPTHVVYNKNNLQSAPGTSFSGTDVVLEAGWPWAYTGLFPVDKCPALWRGSAAPPFYFQASSCTPGTAEEKEQHESYQSFLPQPVLDSTVSSFSWRRWKTTHCTEWNSVTNLLSLLLITEKKFVISESWKSICKATCSPDYRELQNLAIHISTLFPHT